MLCWTLYFVHKSHNPYKNHIQQKCYICVGLSLRKRKGTCRPKEGNKSAREGTREQVPLGLMYNLYKQGNNNNKQLLCASTASKVR